MSEIIFTIMKILIDTLSVKEGDMFGEYGGKTKIS